MVDEETPLTGGKVYGTKTMQFNIERIRLFGLLGAVVLILVGTFVSKYAVVFPPKDDPSTFLEKLMGAPSDFVSEKTFIYQFFGFNHTCSMLDFNPSKTISALIIMLHIMPMDFFIICHYLRVTTQTDPKYDNLKKVTKIFSPLEFAFMTYFYLVFVNSPDGVYGTHAGTMKFIAHYTPYMLWQLGMVMMAIQQCWYIALKDMIPLSWVTKEMMWTYCQMMMVMFVVYTVFCWAFIVGSPLWPTTSDHPVGQFVAKCVMYGWDLISIAIPAYFAYLESSDGNDTQFTFKELQ
mmetsp:Transcript_17131/g.37181  ORF Transcript_17131/g.37181 Transcript_17131/m.37181 type:complete len:292 (+) Transcript_17131:109-984(+)